MRRRRRNWVWVAAFTVLLLAHFVWRCFVRDREPSQLAALHEGRYRLVRVVDGDTILVQSIPQGANEFPGQARVRLLGIDAPETVKPHAPVEPWGPEASEFTKRFLTGQMLVLQLDRRRVDRYGRFLAYVFVGDAMLNEALVSAGLARTTNYPGDSPQIARQLRAAEAQAQRDRRGIWSASPVSPAPATR